MLRDANIVTTLPVVDLDRARKFYEEKLELIPKQEMDQGVVYEAGEKTQLYLYKRDSSKADHTAASFIVKDIEAEVKRLKENGVRFARNIDRHLRLCL